MKKASVLLILTLMLGLVWAGPTIPIARADQNADVYRFATDPNNIDWNPNTHTAGYMEFNFTLPDNISFTRGKYAVIRHSSTGGPDWKIISTAKSLTGSADNQYHVDWNDVVFERGPQQLAIFDGDPLQDSKSELKAIGSFPSIINDLTPALVPNTANQTMGNSLVITFSMNQEFVTKSFPTGIYAVLRRAPDTNSQFVPVRERTQVENLGSDRYRVTWTNATPQPGRFEVVVFDGQDSNPVEKKIYAVKAIGFYEYPFDNNSSPNNPGQNQKLRATAGNGYVALDWDAADNTQGLDGYYLYKGNSPGGEDTRPLFDFPVNALNYKDTQVVNGTTYYYIMKPCYNKGTLFGASSNEASATPREAAAGTIILTIGNPYMQVNGQAREIDPGKGTAPTIVSGRTFLPIGALIGAMGGSISWDGREDKVTIVYRGQTIVLWIGKTTALINSNEQPFDVAPYISDTGRTMLPLSFIVANLGCDVIWNGPDQMVTIKYGS
ncbi:MAG: copper amine oxidase N-terminal domain-containing protein [Syntrophomonas sp.]